jgi:hypothetical protein
MKLVDGVFDFAAKSFQLKNFQHHSIIQNYNGIEVLEVLEILEVLDVLEVWRY